MKQGIVIRLLVGDGALSAKMQDYVLIAGCDEHGAELYAEMARAEGLQAIALCLAWKRAAREGRAVQP